MDRVDTTLLLGEFASSSWFFLKSVCNRVQDFTRGFHRPLPLSTMDDVSLWETWETCETWETEKWLSAGEDTDAYTRRALTRRCKYTRNFHTEVDTASGKDIITNECTKYNNKDVFAALSRRMCAVYSFCHCGTNESSCAKSPATCVCWVWIWAMGPNLATKS